MSHSPRHVAKQATWLMLASTLQKAIAFFAFTIVARLLGPEPVGVYFYLLSLSSFAGAWTDLGLTPVIIRAFAADEARGWALVRRAMVAKACLVPLAGVLALGYMAFVAGETVSTLALFSLALLIMAEDALSLLAYGILRGKGQLHKESLGMVIGQVLSSGALVAFVWLGFGIAGALTALLLGSAWHVLWSVYHVRQQADGWRLGEGASWKLLIREAMPFALAGLFVRVYSTVDALLLRHFYGPAEVGSYAVAYKLTYALQFLPMAFVAALYPSLSAAHAKGDTEGLAHTALGSWRFMAILGFPLAAALSGFAPRLIDVLYGEAFASAARVLAVLAWALPLLFLDFPVGSYLNATHKAVQKTTAMGWTMLVNGAVNLLLVPRIGSVGAAIAALSGYVALLGVGMWYSREVFALRDAWIIAFKGVAVGLLTWLLIVYGLAPLPLASALALAPLGALALLVGTKLLTKRDIVQVSQWVVRRVS